MGLRDKVVSGAIWTFLESVGTKGIRFVVSMIMARLLTPNDYGVVALITVFMAIGAVIADSGLGRALIQKKNPNELDFNSMFYASLMLSLAIYLILFICAPYIGKFYASDESILILRVFSLSLILSAINGVQNAELVRRMRFDISCKIGIVDVIVVALTGVFLAKFGYGPWAIVYSSLAGSLVGTVLRWILIAWRPKLMFSIKSLKELWCYGWKLTMASLLETTYRQLTCLFIGRFYSKSELAFVNRGQAMPSLPMDAIDTTLGKVSFPALSQMQEDKVRVRDAMRRIVSCSSFLVFPMMMGLGVCAEDAVRVIYGTQWLSIVPYVQLSCFSFALWPMHTVNLNAISALGRSDIILVLSIIKKVLCFVGLFATVKFGPWWMVASASIIIGPISLLINVYPSKKLLKYSFGMMMRDIAPSAIICIIMGVLLVYIRKFCMLCGVLPDSFCSAFILLGIQVVCGAVFYIILSWSFKTKACLEYMASIKILRK